MNLNTDDSKFSPLRSPLWRHRCAYSSRSTSQWHRHARSLLHVPAHFMTTIFIRRPPAPHCPGRRAHIGRMMYGGCALAINSSSRECRASARCCQGGRLRGSDPEGESVSRAKASLILCTSRTSVKLFLHSRSQTFAHDTCTSSAPQRQRCAYWSGIWLSMRHRRRLLLLVGKSMQCQYIFQRHSAWFIIKEPRLQR